MPTLIDIPGVITRAKVAKWANQSVSEFMNYASLPDDIESFLSILDSQRIDCILVGGIALLHYVEGRNTDDLDIIIATDELNRIPEIVIDDSNDMFARCKYRQLQVDVLKSEQSFFAMVKSNHTQEAQFLGHNLKIATEHGLALLKLFALPSMYRQHNHSRVRLYEGDLASLLETGKTDKISLLNDLKNHLPANDLSELGKILDELQPDYNRFD